MKYRPEIDGLRTLAVTAVILFHADFKFISGGFIGVDIFFVISGFLITNIIVKEVEQKKFSILKFYEKRARRILPALFTVMLFCIPIAYFLYTPGQFLDFGESLIAVSLFSSNILFWVESGYFDAISEYKPLLHTWSLAVEEQYYIFFPLFIMIFWKFGKKIVISAILVVLILSVILAEYYTFNTSKSVSFYLLPTRLFEILMGSLITFIPVKNITKQSFTLKQILSILGFILVSYSVLFFTNQTPLPGFLTLIPITGTSLIILFANKGTIINQILSTRLMVQLGLISYSTYLWHQPLFAFYKYSNNGELTITIKVVLIIITQILAFLTWKYIENPFRDKQFMSRKKIFSYSITGLSTFILLGFIIKQNDGFSSRSVVQKYKIAGYEIDNHVLEKKALNPIKERTNNTNYEMVNSESNYALWFNPKSLKTKILIVGNSHSNDLYNVLNNSKYAINNYDIARFGIQIKDLGKNFFNSANYKSADIIFICSLLTKEDIKVLDKQMPRFMKDDKKVVLAKNLFLGPNYGITTLADFIIQKNIKAGITDIAKIKTEVNSSYYEYYVDNKDKYQFNQVNIDFIIPLKAKYENLIIMDRNEYIASETDKIFFAVNDSLNKFFPDSSHHTLEGAAFFGNRIDEIQWLEKIIN